MDTSFLKYSYNNYFIPFFFSGQDTYRAHRGSKKPSNPTQWVRINSSNFICGEISTSKIVKKGKLPISQINFNVEERKTRGSKEPPIQIG